MHPNEAHKRTNSAFHVKKLLADHASVLVWQRTQQASMKDRLSASGMEPVLLFPDTFVAAGTLCSELYLPEWAGRPLLILDATWQQARKMYRQSDWLKTLDCWSLPMDQKANFPGLSGFHYQLRKNQHSTGCSTIETVAFAMSLLGEADSARDMLGYFDLFQRDDNDPSRFP